MKRKGILMAFIVLIAGSQVIAQSVAELLAEGARLEKGMKESQALFKYKQAQKKDPDNFTANLKVSWLSSRVGFRLADVEKKREYFKEGMKAAQKALQLAPNSADAHYVMGVATGRLAQVSGAKERVRMLHDIRAHGKKCIEIDPSHAGGYYILARINYRVANLNTAEKAAANLILGGVPKGMTNENALAYYKKAVTLRPDYILYWRDLAIAYAKNNHREKAIAACKKALSLPIQTEDDPGYKVSCKSMLAKLQK